MYPDGVFSFVETFEGQSVDLMVSEYDSTEEKAKLEKQLEEVRLHKINVHMYIKPSVVPRLPKILITTLDLYLKPRF